MVLTFNIPVYHIDEKHKLFILFCYISKPFFICLTEGNILVEDIVKLASQTEENIELEETAR